MKQTEIALDRRRHNSILMKSMGILSAYPKTELSLSVLLGNGDTVLRFIFVPVKAWFWRGKALE